MHHKIYGWRKKIHYGFQLLANIITESLDNIQKMNQTIISEKRVKNSVKKRLHIIKQTNY